MLFRSATLSLAALALLPSALAHFTMSYPPTRFFDEDKESQICGGSNTPSATRTPFSLTNTSMQIDSGHDTATVQVLISFDAAPTTFFQFSNGTTLPLIRDSFSIQEGSACFFVDVSKAISGQTIKNGTEATLMVRYSGGDGDLYQCSDVVLLDNYTAPSNSTTCAASVTSTPAAAPSGSAAAASASATKAASAGERNAASGAGLMAVLVAGVAVLF